MDMIWIYLSPHLDDAVFSCGGLIWEQVRKGDRVDIWTICAGDPPQGELSPFAAALHERWETGKEAVAVRRQEDLEACRIVKARPRHFDLPDVIYRRFPVTGEPLIQENDDLWRPLSPQEAPLVRHLAAQLVSELPPEAVLVSPLTLGGHVDHRLTREAAELIIQHRQADRLSYYADFPYILAGKAELTAEITRSALHPEPFLVSPEGLAAWQAANAAYRSQISTFWGSVDELEAITRRYWAEGGGGLFTPFRLSGV